MANERKIKQLIMETRNIVAEMTDEGGEISIKSPVFAWVLYDDDDIEPWFIDKAYQINEYPYGVETIKRVSKKDVGIVEYEWER